MIAFINAVFDQLGFIFLAFLGVCTLGGLLAYLIELYDSRELRDMHDSGE
jgi:hypothetical protein